MLFAFLGTFVASICTSGLVYLAGYMGICMPLTLKESSAFGALISSTDPVAVLSIFKEINADSALYQLVNIFTYISLDFWWKCFKWCCFYDPL